MMFHRAALSLSLFLITAVSLAGAQETAPPTKIPEGEMTGLILERVNPTYPPLARQARIQGTVILQVTISTSGYVKSIQLISGHPILAPAAIEAVRQWKYKSYMVNGEPVEVQTQVQVNFVLSDQPRMLRGPQNVPDVSAQGRVNVSENVMRGMRIQEIDAAYPPLALQGKIQGMVEMKAIIDKSGEVEDVELISGHPMLAPAAIDAVKQWRYRPYELNGEPVVVETLVRVNFVLSEEKANRGSATDADLPPAPKESVPTESQPGNPAAPVRIRVSSGVESGLLIRKVNPAYPPDARAQGVQGVVLMQAIIDPDGNVADLQLISGHPLLAPAAMEAVKQWKYKPFLLNGKPMEVETKVQVNFTLTSN